MHTLKADLNTQINSLLAAFAATPQPISDLPLASREALLADFAQAAQNCRLTDQELAIAQPTVERIETSDQMDEYIRHFARHYLAIVGTDERPEWILRKETKPEHYAEFATSLDMADAQIISAVEEFHGLSQPHFSTLYERYQTLLAAEELAGEAAQKVRDALDLRVALVGMLRYVGLVTSQIDELI